MSDPVAGLREDWVARRLAVADRWREVADRYGKPASGAEVGAAVADDHASDLNERHPGREDRLLYDRRALLNIIAALLAADKPDEGLAAAVSLYLRLDDALPDIKPDTMPTAVWDARVREVVNARAAVDVYLEAARLAREETEG